MSRVISATIRVPQLSVAVLIEHVKRLGGALDTLRSLLRVVSDASLAEKGCHAS
jgi:hypothetical protein